MNISKANLEKSGRSRKRMRGSIAATAIVTTISALVAGCSPKGAGDAKSAAAASPGASPSAEPATPVDVATASRQTVDRLVPVSGSITALQNVSLMPKVTANVLYVAGREGDPVQAGQVVVKLDPSDFETQLRQAQANLQDARAKLTQAKTNYQLQKTQSATAVQNAESALQAAQENLLVAKQPQRNEQIKQSQIMVEQAQANYDKAVSDRKRYESLFKDGATSESTLEGYQTTEKVQLATLDNAKQALQISQAGGRSEDIRASQEQVRQATIALQLAKSNVQQVAVKQDDIRSAAATVAQDEAAAMYQQQQISYCTVRTPISGIIASRSTDPGTLAGPGTTNFSSGSASSSGSNGSVMQIVALGNVYFQAQVPETEISNVSVGKLVRVKVDAYPQKMFTGRVTNLYPTADTTSRNFNVRVTVGNDAHMLRPGMYVRANVVADSRAGVVVPKDAVVSDGTTNQAFVYLVGENKAVRRQVQLGIQTDQTSEILSGIHAGDQVIVAGQDGLKDGSLIHVAQVTGAAAGDATAAPVTGKPYSEASR